MPPPCSPTGPDGVKWSTLEAIERLITAGESGKRAEIAKATARIEFVLRGRSLLDRDQAPRDTAESSTT